MGNIREREERDGYYGGGMNFGGRDRSGASDVFAVFESCACTVKQHTMQLMKRVTVQNSNDQQHFFESGIEEP
jgi:ribonuclease HIII